MEKAKAVRITLDETLKNQLEETQSELERRGVTDSSPTKLVEEILKTIDLKVLSDIVERLTPLEFHLKAALQDERKRAQIMKIIGSKAPLKAEELLSV